MCLSWRWSRRWRGWRARSRLSTRWVQGQQGWADGGAGWVGGRVCGGVLGLCSSQVGELLACWPWLAWCMVTRHVPCHHVKPWETRAPSCEVQERARSFSLSTQAYVSVTRQVEAGYQELSKADGAAQHIIAQQTQRLHMLQVRGTAGWCRAPGHMMRPEQRAGTHRWPVPRRGLPRRTPC